MRKLLLIAFVITLGVVGCEITDSSDVKVNDHKSPASWPKSMDDNGKPGPD